MANRFEDEFPRAAQRYRVPPPEDIERYLERARRLRAEAMRRALRHLGSAVARAVRAVIATPVRRPARAGRRPAASHRL